MKRNNNEFEPDKEKLIFTNDYMNFVYLDLEEFILNFRGKNPKELWPQKTSIDYDMKNLVEALSQSVYYRNIIKEHSAEEAVEIFRSESHACRKYINQEMLTTLVADTKAKMGPFTITRLPNDATIEIGGRKFKGIDAIKAAVKNNEPNICERWEGFPCFDSYDYASEDRRYHNYWFCSIDSEIWKKICQLKPTDSNYCFASEKLDPEAIPMVYFCDERPTMLFVY